MTPTAIAKRLANLRDRICKAEDNLADLYAQRLIAWKEARSIDPVTGESTGDPKLIFPEIAKASNVSEQAVHKALRRDREINGTGASA